MRKALFKKQMLEVFAWLYKEKKSGKIRTRKGVIGYAAMYLVLFGIIGVLFGSIAKAICQPLLSIHMGWIYWCLMGLVALFMGVFGSVFNTYSSLYQAKDNDFLLSMPIPVSYLLLMRLSGVYAMGLLYELIVMIPTVLIWLLHAPFTVWGTVNVLLIPVVLSLLVLVLSVALGWLIAVLMTKVRHKNRITVVLSLLFIVAYYWIYAKAYVMLQSFLLYAENMGRHLRIALYPLYQMGLAAEGNVLAMLIFMSMSVLVLLFAYWVLSNSFLKLVTADRGAVKAVYREQTVKAVSVNRALLQKEFRRFTGSANYMLNCGLGIVLMPASAVLLVWKAETLRPLFSLCSAELLSLLAIAAVCSMTAMNDMTAPSISLEGKSLWILQSFPVSGRQVLGAKLKMHLLLTVIPAIAPVLAAEWLFRPTPFYAVTLPLTVLLFILLLAAMGLFLNLKMPNFHWTSEVIPIKQSVPVSMTLLGGLALVAAAAGMYLLFQKYLPSFRGEFYLVGLLFLLAAADGFLLHWLMTTGVKIFEECGEA